MDVLERPALDEPSVARSARRRLRSAGLVIALAVLALAVGGVRAWWPHDVFGPSGNEIGIPLEVGQIGLVGVEANPEHPVRLLHVEPVIAEGSAPAAISFLLCDSDMGIGAMYGAKVVESTCPGGVTSIDTHPTLAPITLDRDPQLVAVIVPLMPGTVTVEGIRITYRDSGLTRTEHTGVGITVTSSTSNGPDRHT